MSADERLRSAATRLREDDATMDPGVALALADWLDAVADDYAIAQYGYWSVRALAVADAVLGGERS